MTGAVVVVVGGALAVVTTSVNLNGGRVAGVGAGMGSGTGREGLPMGRVVVVVTAAVSGALRSPGRSSPSSMIVATG